ncbi:hypothetical protein J8805_29295, partial [Klebsiella pneumoniae]
VSLPLLAWIAQSPVIIISGEQATSYEYGMLQVPIFGALIAGNGLFSLFNLLGGVLWLGLMIYFLKDKSVGNSQQG